MVLYSAKQLFHNGIKRQKTIKKSKMMKKYIIIFGLAGIILYLFLTYNINEEIASEGGELELSKNMNILNNFRDDRYFVNLSGCKIPSFDFRYGGGGVTTNKINHLPSSIICHKSLTTIKHNYIFRNMENSEIQYFYNISNIQNISCIYQSFYRINDVHNQYNILKQKFDLFEPIMLKKSENYIKVMCTNNKTKTFYDHFHYHNKLDDIVTKAYNKNHKISVMVISFRDLSHYNFLRKMRKTTKLLRNLDDKLLAVEFFGFNRIGKNNYDNLIPLLSGFNEDELISACLHPYQNQSYDQCPFIWKIFKDKGYKTVFAEDVAHLGVFNYFRQGFIYPPTDFYLRPFIIEIEKLIKLSNIGNISARSDLLPCGKINNSVDFILQFINNLIPQYLTNIFFSFYQFSSTINIISNNNYYNITNLMDYELYSLILKMKDTKILNKTILFFISDRGEIDIESYKNTYQGIMEERLPLFYAIVPSWFQAQYSDAIYNLRNNARKLTTHYDLHETLLDLSDLSSITNQQIYQRTKEIIENDVLPRGISLFLNIPNHRSCEHAGISYNWCTCYEKQIFPTNNPKIQRAARYIIQRLNEKIRDYPQCRTLHLNSILHATVSSANKKVLKGIKGEYISEVMVRIQTKPGLAEYEAVIRMTSYLSFVVGNITRINFNGKYSYCITDNNLRAFCYCLR